MPEVRIAEQRLWVGDQSLPFLSGSIHYWRLNPHIWPRLLGRVQELGFSIFSTYVCWDYHELAPGQFDFTGRTDPQRNLAGFLELVANSDLKLLIRPGPYLYAEWHNAGLPDRVVRYHRLSPEFRDASAEYMAAVVEVIRPYLATNGGPIILFQAENEPDPWHHIYEKEEGFGDTPGLFQEFLRERYQRIEALNDAWETKLDDFNRARPVTSPAIKTRGYLNRYLDFVRFRHWGIRQIMQWTVDTYRSLGIDVPIYVNAYTIFDIQNWREQEQICDLVGPDAYPAQEFSASPDEHWKFLDVFRYPRCYSALPCIPELQAGIWDGGQYSVGMLTPNHYRMVALSALLAGIVGWDWYMLVSRDNWLMSSINEWGNLRPHLTEEFAELIRMFKEIDPPGLEKQVHTAVTVDVVERTARLGSGEKLRRALYAADIDYDCFDVATGRIAHPLLFYGGGDWLDEAAQRRLDGIVQAGGNLVFFQEYPLLDEQLYPVNIFDLPQPDSILQAGYPQRLAIRLGGETVTLSSGAFFIFEDVPGEPLIAERVNDAIMMGDELAQHVSLPVGQRYTVGFRQKRGKGSVIVLGVEPDPALLVALHRWLGVSVPSRATLDQVTTALFRREETFYLIAVNNGGEERYVRVALDAALFAGGRGWDETVLAERSRLSCQTRSWSGCRARAGRL